MRTRVIARVSATPTIALAPLLLLLLLAAACGEDDKTPVAPAAMMDAGGDDVGGDTSDDVTPDAPDAAPEIYPGCNPLAPEHDCLLPFPSDFFLKDDPTLPSGKRVVYSEAARLVSELGGDLDYTERYGVDGFSWSPTLLAVFPEGVDPGGLTFHTGDVSATLSASSTTILLNADTGEPVLHFAELDPQATDDARRALVIRPLVRLEAQTRYVVAIHGLETPTGAPVTPPAGFATLKGGAPTTTLELAELAARYDADVFAPLTAFGVARDDLQLAWDFTTGSMDHATADLMAMREDTLAARAVAAPSVTIETVTAPEDDPLIHRIIEGTFTAPLYLDSEELAANLTRDVGGRPVANATVEVPFLVLIPASAAARLAEEGPARVIQFGHGFFGSRKELLDNDAMPDFAERTRSVMVAVDWLGMSVADPLEVARALANEPRDAFRFTDRVHQAMVHQLILSDVIARALPEAPEAAVDDTLVYDPSAIYYYGLSNGHILGGTFVAISPDIERAVFGVGGAGYSFIMFRSGAFQPLFLIVAAALPDALDQQKWVALTQTSLDRIDPITYANTLLTPSLPMSPPSRKVLIQIGLGDAQVPNLASQYHARSVGAGLLQPSPRQIVGLEPVQAPYDGSALVEFDFDLDIDPLPGTFAEFPEPNDVHEAVRRTDKGIEQIDAFLREGGMIVNTCDGVCDPD